jgi:hypothetical protein
MKEKVENTTYFITLVFALFVIILQSTVIVINLLK